MFVDDVGARVELSNIRPERDPLAKDRASTALAELEWMHGSIAWDQPDSGR
jgi:hypothetical protein